MITRYLLSALLLVFGSTAFASDDCLVIGHRGASAYLPEHTLAAYQKAIEMGADYIEPDLVLTKDGVPIARHENRLELTTDIASRPEFAERKSQRTKGDETIEGWFSEDFTLAEIRTLRAIERYPNLRAKSHRYSGQYTVPTLQEVLDLIKSNKDATGTRIGVYPELKQPAVFAASGLDIVTAVIDVLAANGYTSADSRAFLQSFDDAALRRAAGLTDLPLVQLLSNSDLEQMAEIAGPAGMTEIAAYAAVVGAPKYPWVMRPGPEGNDTFAPEPTPLIRNAHDAGLLVHAYTFRAENRWLPEPLRSSDNPAESGDLAAELLAFREAGIDGVFADNPDIATAVCTPNKKLRE